MDGALVCVLPPPFCLFCSNADFTTHKDNIAELQKYRKGHIDSFMAQGRAEAAAANGAPGAPGAHGARQPVAESLRVTDAAATTGTTVGLVADGPAVPRERKEKLKLPF